MTKSELIKKIADYAEITKAQADVFLDAFNVTVSAALLNSDDVTIPGIGRLSVFDKPERQGRNPSTGEALTIPARKAVRFKASAILKDYIQ